ncbi:HD family phosphohydrolase [Gordonia sp. NPDC003429]
MVLNDADPLAELSAVLASLRNVWDEEAVDELDHALQAGHLATADHADDELVLAAVLHDVAHSPMIGSDAPHDEAARRWLTPRFGERVGWLAGSHVAAKKWLAATDHEYAAGLSATSVRSLAAQGGAQLVGRQWTEHRWWPDAIRLRRYDDAAKTPGAAGLDPAEVMAVAGRVMAAGVAG